MPRLNNKYQMGSDMFYMCRVCLTQSSTGSMIDLQDTFDAPSFDENGAQPIIYALQMVTSHSVVLKSNYPHYICPMCFSILRIAYKFIIGFKESQEKLKNMLNEIDEEVDVKPDPLKLNFMYDDDHIEYVHLPDSPKFEQKSFKKVKSNRCKILENRKSSEAEDDKLFLDDFAFDKNTSLGVSSNFGAFLGKSGNKASAPLSTKKEMKGKYGGKHSQDLQNDSFAVLVKNENEILPISEMQIDEKSNILSYKVEEGCKIDNFEYIIDVKDELTDVDEALDVKVELTDTDEKFDKLTDVNVKFESHQFDLRNSDTEFDESSIGKDLDLDPAERELIESLIIEEGKEYSNSLDISSLKKKLEEKKEDVGIAIMYPCEMCDATFPVPKAVRRHMRRVHFPSSKEYICDICNMKCRTRSAYTNHRLKHVGRKWTCETCGKMYYTKKTLQVHLETHKNDRNHLCNVCGKSFNYTNSLVYHMRVHTGEKNYQCVYCDKQFRMPNSLKRHERIHTGEKPFLCRFCDKRFRSRGELQCHENVHTGYRPYLCKFCRKGFTKTHNLKLHLLQHSGDYGCTFCRKKFIDQELLMLHCKISHENSVLDKISIKLSNYYCKAY